ncbi:hypothetical protein C0Q70_02243, partial [Pomacea canaliculata]
MNHVQSHMKDQFRSVRMSSNSGWLVCEQSGGSKVRVGVKEGKSGQAPKNDTYRARVRVCVLARVRHDPSVLLTCKGEGMKEGGEREDEGRVARQRAFLIGARGKLPPLIDREGQRLADSSRVLSLSLTHTLTLAFITRVAQARVQAACVSRRCTYSAGRCLAACSPPSLSLSCNYSGARGGGVSDLQIPRTQVLTSDVLACACAVRRRRDGDGECFVCIVNVCGAPSGAEGYTKLCFSRCEDGSAPDLEAIVEVRELLYTPSLTRIKPSMARAMATALWRKGPRAGRPLHWVAVFLSLTLALVLLTLLSAQGRACSPNRLLDADLRQVEHYFTPKPQDTATLHLSAATHFATLPRPSCVTPRLTFSFSCPPRHMTDTCVTSFVRPGDPPLVVPGRTRRRRRRGSGNVRQEAERHGDVLVVDVSDTYRNLVHKILHGLRWAARHCAAARFVLKADADSFVDVDRLLSLLFDTPTPWPGSGVVLGDILCAEP